MQLLDHLSLTVSDLAAAKPFYKAIFQILGAQLVYEEEAAIGFGERNSPGQDQHTYISIFESAQAGPDARRHCCFKATSVAQVQAFYQAGLRAGGSDAGAPGLRTDYHQRYYAAFLFDPLGNKIEAVYHRATASE